ncbi:hypothetical protein MPLSOD_90084 [Mesorhizobium sp. SOD10]|nr:hypothetical protein MPLSOD_90084 [Mesorhizobium sp. SOD10]
MQTDFDTLTNFVGQQLIRGKLTPNTANSYHSSLNRVFECATDAEKANVFNIDLHALFARFRQANTDLGDSTAASYEGRVRAAIKSFAGFIAAEGKISGTPATMGTLSIPIRAGLVKIDGLPSDLTAAEANRIATMIAAMAT